MSQENVEIVKRALDAYNRRDVDAFIEFAAPDFEWFTSTVGAVEGGSFRGREGIETYFHEVSDTWEEVHAVADEVRDLGDRVLVLGRFAGRGRGSGVPVDAPQGIIYDLRAGKISRIRAYLDHGEALRAAGLVE